MKIHGFLAFILLGSAALAGCGGREERPVEKTAEGKASGRILQRSISDEMLPYDTLTSQPPGENPEQESDADAGGADGMPATEATPDEE